MKAKVLGEIAGRCQVTAQSEEALGNRKMSQIKYI